MTLHETYAALIRRGMPKHPHLVWNDRSDDALGISVIQWALCGLPTHDFVDDVEMVLISPDLLTEELARDLITCHALRWQPGLNCMEFISNWAMLRDKPDRWLDAILAATEHLEPKESK